jgi:hypothetical protein
VEYDGINTTATYFEVALKASNTLAVSFRATVRKTNYLDHPRI